MTKAKIRRALALPFLYLSALFIALADTIQGK